MAATREVIEWVDQFDRAQELGTTPGQNGWTIADTSAAGTPTYLAATNDGGGMVLTLAANSEAENVCMFHNNVLMFDLAQIQIVEMVAKVAAVDAVSTIVFGIGSARNDTPDSVGVNAWFRIEGSVDTGLIVCETDDNTTDNDDKATAVSLSSTLKRFVIDFQNGLADVRFYIDGQRVAAATTFNMSAVTAGQNVQPIIQIQKASGTGVPSITMAKYRVRYRKSMGA